MIRWLWWGVLCSGLCWGVGCGFERPALPPPLASLQPHISHVSPAPDQLLSPTAPIALQLSSAIAPQSVTAAQVGVIGPLAENPPDAVIQEQLAQGTGVIASIVDVSEDQMAITVTPQTVWPAGSGIAAVIAPDVHSVDGLPVGTTVGESAGVVVRFTVAPDDSPQISAATGSPVDDHSGDPLADSPVAASSSVSATQCLINELLYDVPGADTNGDVFLELACDPSGSVGQWSVRFMNGDDGAVTSSLTIPGESIVPASGLFVIADMVSGSATSSHVEAATVIMNFDPQNGPDSVQLLNASGQLVDVLGYGGDLSQAIDHSGLPMVQGAPVQKITAGQSVARHNGHNTNNNLADFSAGDPTPGAW